MRYTCWQQCVQKFSASLPTIFHSTKNYEVYLKLLRLYVYLFMLVCLAGQKGTIDGQGRMWWELWWNKTLEHTRGHLVELMNSHNILISNLTFLNSPFWTIHPVYCRFSVPCPQLFLSCCFFSSVHDNFVDLRCCLLVSNIQQRYNIRTNSLEQKR